MGTSNSPLAYDDIRDALDRAIASERGIKIVKTTLGEAVHLKQRIYKFRQIDRKQSLSMFKEGDTRRGTSVYDSLAIEQVENILFLRRRVAGALKIEEIEE